MLSAEDVCCKKLPNIYDEISIEANSVDSEQTDLGPFCLPYRLLKHFSRPEKQTTFVAIGALRVKLQERLKAHFIFQLKARKNRGTYKAKLQATKITPERRKKQDAMGQMVFPSPEGIYWSLISNNSHHQWSHCVVSLSMTLYPLLSTGPEAIKLFPCSTQLSTKLILLITGILTFISMINTTSERLKARNLFICLYFSFYEEVKFHAQLS